MALVCKEINRLLKTQLLAILATAGNTIPHASIIAFASVNNGSGLIFITPKHSKKYRTIRHNPNVSLVIDSRPDSSETIQSSCAITVNGSVRILEETDIINYSSLFLQCHPALRPFIKSLDFALVFVEIKKYSYVNSLNTVTQVLATQFKKSSNTLTKEIDNGFF